MGVEYRHFLIPRDNKQRPDAEAISRLISALREGKYISGDPHLRSHSEERKAADAAIGDLSGEFIACWHVDDHIKEGLTYPLKPIFQADGYGGYYDFELRFSEDFVSDANEMIDPIGGECSCGLSLEYEPSEDIFYAPRISATCDACGVAFRPQDHDVTVRDGFTGEEREIKGGLTYRFAIVIDCGKCWDHELEEMPEAMTSFRVTCENALGAPLYELGHFY